MIFKRNKHPMRKGMYVVKDGIFLGDFLVYIDRDQKTDTYVFMVLPDKKERSISKKDFDYGLEKGIVSFVEKLPTPIYKVCVKEYELLFRQNKGK